MQEPSETWRKATRKAGARPLWVVEFTGSTGDTYHACSGSAPYAASSTETAISPSLVSVEDVEATLDPVTRSSGASGQTIVIGGDTIRVFVAANQCIGRILSLYLAAQDVPLVDAPLVGLYVITGIVPAQGTVTISAESMMRRAYDKTYDAWRHLNRSPAEVVSRTLGFADLSTDLYDGASLADPSAGGNPTSHHRLSQETTQAIINDIQETGKLKDDIGSVVNSVCEYTYNAFVPGDDGKYTWRPWDQEAAAVAAFDASTISDLVQEDDLTVINKVTCSVPVSRPDTDDPAQDVTYKFLYENTASQTAFAAADGSDGIYEHEINPGRWAPRPATVNLGYLTSWGIGDELPLADGLDSGFCGLLETGTPEAPGSASWDTNDASLTSTRDSVVVVLGAGESHVILTCDRSSRLTQASLGGVYPLDRRLLETVDSGGISSTQNDWHPRLHRLRIASTTAGVSSPGALVSDGTDVGGVYWTAARAIDITILRNTARKLVSRFRRGAIRLKFRLPLHYIGLQLCDFITITHDVPLKYGYDGETDTNRYEIIRKEITLGDSPGIEFLVCQVRDETVYDVAESVEVTVPPSTGFIVDSTGALIVDSYGRFIRAS